VEDNHVRDPPPPGDGWAPLEATDEHLDGLRADPARTQKVPIHLRGEYTMGVPQLQASVQPTFAN
jgi:hypothetical protein